MKKILKKNIIFKLNFQDKCYTLNNKDRMIVDLKSKRLYISRNRKNVWYIISSDTTKD